MDPRRCVLIPVTVGGVRPVGTIHRLALRPGVVVRAEGPVVFVLQLVLVADVMLLGQGAERVVGGGGGGGGGSAGQLVPHGGQNLARGVGGVHVHPLVLGGQF